MGVDSVQKTACGRDGLFGNQFDVVALNACPEFLAGLEVELATQVAREDDLEFGGNGDGCHTELPTYYIEIGVIHSIGQQHD